jgi:heptosyltransferase-2
MKILVRGTNWIGDAVMTIPALRELRRIFPDSHIALHTRAWAEGIFRDADFLDEIIAYENKGFATVFTQGTLLAREGFDLGVIFPNSFESALQMKLGRVRRRFGYATDSRTILLSDAVEVPEWKASRHEVSYYLNLVAEVEKRMLSTETVGRDEPSTRLPVSIERRERIGRFLKAAGLDPNGKIVGLGVGSTNSRAKRWLPESYAKLSDNLQESGVQVVLLGSNDERDVADTIAGLARSQPVILAGKTDLSEATALLSELDLLISNDMGLAHIAAAVGTKTLTIFGPTNPVTTAPLSPNASIIREPVECSPCMLRDCPIDHRCMTRISVERVFQLAQKALS